MRNSENYMITTGSDPIATDDQTTRSFPGAFVGFVSWLLALGIRFSSTAVTRCSSFSTPGPSSGADARGGCRRHRPPFTANGKLLYSTLLSRLTVVLMFGLLFLWLMG